MTDALIETLRTHRGPKTWAVGVVMTGQEINLACRLKEHGVECYLPTYTRQSRPRARGRRREQETEHAAIPGYIFMKANTITDPEKLKDEPKFLYIIRQERYGDWYLLSDEAIKELRRLDGGVLKRVRASYDFKLWQRVKIPQGAFGGLTGVVTGTFRDRVWVAIHGFQKPISFHALHLTAEGV